MRQSLILLVGLLAGVASVPAQKVFVDYDSATAFSQIRTYQLRDTRLGLQDTYPDIHRQIVVKIKTYLQEGGMTDAVSDPDVLVAYYTADARDLRLALSDLEYSYGPDFSFGNYWEGGVGTRTPSSFQFREGTLIIDVWNAREKQLVFRGIATSAIPKDYDKRIARVDKALEKIIKTWGEMKGDHIRALRRLREEQQ